MRNEFTAVVERDKRWYVAYCPEIPGANGQGRTKSAALKSLTAAIALILEDRRKALDHLVRRIYPSVSFREERRGSSGTTIFTAGSLARSIKGIRDFAEVYRTQRVCQSRTR